MMKVLVVEDEEHMARRVAAVLMSSGEAGVLKNTVLWPEDLPRR